jgi:hypothetical protein
MITAVLFSLLMMPTDLDGLMNNGQSSPFVAPGQLFQISIPYGWTPFTVNKDPNAIQFRNSARGGDAMLTIRKFVVPEEAKPRQLILNAIDTQLSKLPRWRTIQKRDLSIGGAPGASVLGGFAYQGNLQYPRMVEVTFVVYGTEAYSMYFECLDGTGPQYVQELTTFYTTFTPRVAGSTIRGPFSVPDDSGSNETYRVPDPKDIPF